MTKWNIISLEGFCMFDSMRKKKSKYYHYGKGVFNKDGTMKKPTKVESKINPMYIKGDRPTWCKKKYPGRKERTPEFKCFGEDKCDKCPFFAFTDVDKIDQEIMNASFHIKEVKCWDDDKMKVSKKCCKKFIEHMNTFKKE